MNLEFANYSAWEWFNATFPIFVEKHETLESLRDKMFVRRVEPRGLVDIVIFGLGRICVEDFEQALNLCGNGFGIGAMQMVRGMYERQVTAAYLSKHPEEVDNFLDYHFVQARKGLNQLKDVYRGQRDILDNIVSEERRNEIEQEFQAVREKYTETVCNTCGKTRTMFSWTKHHTGVLALKGEQGLDKLYHYQYFRPTMFSHSTVSSLEARIVFKEAGGFSFESEGQQKHIKEALLSAHNLLLNVFDLHNKHFGLGMDAELEECCKNYLECWIPKSVSKK